MRLESSETIMTTARVVVIVYDHKCSSMREAIAQSHGGSQFFSAQTSRKGRKSRHTAWVLHP